MVVVVLSEMRLARQVCFGAVGRHHKVGAPSIGELRAGRGAEIRPSKLPFN